MDRSMSRGRRRRRRWRHRHRLMNHVDHPEPEPPSQWSETNNGQPLTSISSSSSILTLELMDYNSAQYQDQVSIGLSARSPTMMAIRRSDRPLFKCKVRIHGIHHHFVSETR